jgi:Lon protease-like protein
LDSIPDTWPPSPGSGEEGGEAPHAPEAEPGPDVSEPSPPRNEIAPDAPVAPLFPLPNVFLFPGCVMPLHVFEPRYRQMIGDLLDGPGRLVLGSVVGDHVADLAGSPPVHPTAGLGEIGRHEKLPDGRFLIYLIGLSRVAIDEVPSDRLYRRVRYVPVPDVDVGETLERELRPRLERAILKRDERLLNLPDDVTVGCLTDLLLQHLELPPSLLCELYSESSVARRAQRALAEHDRRPPK